jgi:hypothetical protein
MKKRYLAIVAALAILVNFSVMAQTSPDDPAVVKAKEETAVVFDLGRVFGFIHTMEKEEPTLALSKDQINALYRIMGQLNALERVEADQAEEMLVQIEDEILTPDQLLYVDQLAIARVETRESSTTTQTTGSGGGQILSYIAGGAFNPMRDTTKTIGKDFAAFFDYLKKKVG